MIRRIALLFILCISIYAVSVAVFPLFFLNYLADKYSISLQGKKSFFPFQPKIKIRNASFIWNEKVELQNGDFEVEVNPLRWLQSRVWSIRMKGDGAEMRFLGDWLTKTGIDQIKTTRLRLALEFSNEGISDIQTVDLVAPNYQLQIHSREAKRS